jgi:hypothetical protein
MSFNKFIARLVKTARDQVVKIEDLAEKQITNVANTGVDFVKNSVPFDIPIELDADELIEGKKPDTSKLLLPITISTLAASAGVAAAILVNKQQIEESTDKLSKTLNTTLSTLSAITAVVTGVKSILATLGSTSKTLDISGKAVDFSIDLITKLPIPTGAPIGVGLPLNVITTLSNSLVKLDDTAKEVQGAAELIEETATPVRDTLEDILDAISIVLNIVTTLLAIITFVRVLVKKGQNVTQEDIDETARETNEEFIEELENIGNSSNVETNQSINSDLSDRLLPNSTNPLIYKDFLLRVEFGESETNLPLRRINAVNVNNSQIKLATDFSFASSLEVLVKEIQFQIDNYDLVFIQPPTIPVGDIPEGINSDLINIEDISVDIDDIDISEAEETEETKVEKRFTKKEIREKKRKERRKSFKERFLLRKKGEITRKEAVKARREDRKERKDKAKERRQNRKRKKEK